MSVARTDIGLADRAPTVAPFAEHAELGVASRRIITAFGFWVFLLSDVVMFSAFFATYIVLENMTAGGPSGKELFNLNAVALETGCLLASSLSCGMASLGARARADFMYYGSMFVTAILGVAFLLLELRDFTTLIAQGAGPSRSAFLTGYFALVGCHGVHVTVGVLFLLTMMAQVYAKGYRADVLRRLLCFALFWHTLDIIWVGIFTVVYLLGVAP
jgi:cytochrome o ubiquinol oxidase subunit III